MRLIKSPGFVAPLSFIFEDIGAKEDTIIIIYFSTYEVYFHHQIRNNNYFWTRHCINYLDNKSLKFKRNMNIIWEIYMVVEKEGFGAFKIIRLICCCLVIIVKTSFYII